MCAMQLCCQLQPCPEGAVCYSAAHIVSWPLNAWAQKNLFHTCRETHAHRGNQLVCVKSRQTDVIEPKKKKKSPVFWHSW